MIAKLLLFGWLFGSAAVTPADVIGFYDVVGTGDTGMEYRIVAEVRELQGALHVRWSYSPGDHSFGHGFITKDRTFVVGFYGRMTGAAEFERTKTGWAGEWSHDGRRYPERWTRREGPTPAQLNEPTPAPLAQPGQAL